MPAVEEIILGDAPQEVVLGDAPAATATMERPQQQPKQWQGVSLSPTLQEEQKFNEQLGIPKPEMGTFPYDEVVAETAKQARELVEGRAKRETFGSFLSEVKSRFGMQFYNQAIVPIVNTALSLPQKGAMPAIEKAMGQKPTKPLQISPLELYQPKEGETPLPETAIDIGAGLSAFGTKLAVASAIGIPAPLAWEAINLNSGGTPGEGLLQYYTFKNIGDLPAETILGKLAKTGAESSALMAITSSGKDATIKDTFVMGAIPWASAGLRILRSGGSMKQAINVIKTEKPELKVVPEVEMEKMLKSATALQRQVPTMTTEPTTMPTKPSGLPVEAVKPAKPTKLPTVDELLAKTGISRAQLENAQINRGQPWADEIIAKVEAQIPPPSEFSIAEMKPLWDELKLKYHELGTARIEAARGMAGGFEPDPVISVKGKGEGGFIGVEGRPTGEIKKPWLDLDKVKSSNPEIETFFGRTERPPYSKKASGLISKIREGLRERFIFAYHLPDVPENALYRDMIRTMPEERRLMGEKAIKDIVKILDNDGSVQALDSAGLDLLRRKVFTQDILREAEIDRSIAGDLKLDQLQAENQRLDMLIEQVPSVKKAFEARQKLWSDTTNDLVKRGVLDEESAKNTAYVRHFVLDLAEKNRPTGFLRKKLSEPYRAYAKERKGSHKDISTDYLSVEVKALRDIYQDNAVEDMANKIGEKADKRKDYSDTARKQNIKLAGQIPEGLTGFSVDKYLRETLGDKYVSPEKLALQDGFVEWHYKRPNIFYRAATMNEAKVAALIENMAEDAGGMIQIPKDQIRSALALGRHKGWLIPEELAKQLDDLPVNKRSNMVVESFTKPFIQFIKRWYLRTNPLRYNTRNALGDTEGLNVAGQTGALKKIPEAVKVLIQKNSPEYDILRKYGGAGSSLWNEMGDFSKLPEFERFRKLTNQKDFVDTVKSIFGTPLRLAGKVGNIEQNLTQFREDILRAAVFLDNYEKLKAGEPVRNWAGNLTNVMEIAKTDIGRAAVKISRETLGDYGNFTPFENNVLRQGLIPFYSWMKINGLRWPSVVKSAAREGVASKVITTGVIKAGLGVASWTVRAMGVYGAVYLWNHRDDKATKKEATLPFWLRAQPHLNIGDMTLWGQTSLSDFAEWYGEEQLSGILWRHEAGLIDSKEAALEAAKIIAQAPVEKIYQAFNPYLKAPIVAISGVETYPQVFKPQYVAPPASNKSLERAMLDIMGGDAKKFYQSISGKRAFDDTLYAYFAGWFGRPADPETMIKEVGQMKAWTTLKMKSQTTGRGKGQAKSGKEPEWQEVKIRERALGVNVPIPPSQKKKTSKKLKQETVGR